MQTAGGGDEIGLFQYLGLLKGSGEGVEPDRVRVEHDPLCHRRFCRVE